MAVLPIVQNALGVINTEIYVIPKRGNNYMVCKNIVEINLNKKGLAKNKP